MKMFRYFNILTVLMTILMSAPELCAQDSLHHELGEVVVNATTVSTRGNKTTYRITRQMRKGTVSTAEMIGRLPSFNFNPATKEVRYNNSTSIVVLVDGIEKPITNVFDLEHIRFDRMVLTDRPQGKYQGAEVLIEFFTKEDYEGYEGQIGSLVMGRFNDNEDETIGCENSWVYGTFTKNRWTVFARAAHNWDATVTDRWASTQYLINGMTENISPVKGGPRNWAGYRGSLSAYASADYMIDSKSSFSIVYAYDNTNSRDYFNQHIKQTFDNSSAAKEFMRDNRTRATGNSHATAVFYRNSRHRVNFDVDFNYRFMPSTSLNTVTEPDINIKNDFRDRMNFTRFRASGNTQLKDGLITLTFGYENTWKDYNRRRNENNELLSTNSYMRNKLYAGVGMSVGRFNFNITPWIEQVHAKTDGKSEDTYPLGGSAMAFYRITPANWIRFNYSCGTSYPDQAQSSEWGYFTSPLIWEEGNPFLKTNVTHSLNLWLDMWRCFNIQCGMYYSPNSYGLIYGTKNGMTPAGVSGPYITAIYENYKHKTYWTSASVTKRLWKDFVYKADIRYSYMQAYTSLYHNRAHSIDFSTSLTYYNTRHNFTAQVVYAYIHANSVTPQSTTKSGFENPQISITKSFLKRRLTIGLTYACFFQFAGGNNTETILDTPGMKSVSLDKNFNRSKNRAWITLSYRFSGGKSVRQYNRDLSNER
ncbi:hypothetical protein D7V95_01380 [bacterium J10(2018)]|jgi:hypothetical protein|nr:hypothetical protein D7V95_01380 [bacterium J10(2018)]